MRNDCLTIAISMFTATLAGAAFAEDAHVHEDVVVGRTGAGQLAAEFDWAEVHQLPAVNGLFNGWAGDDPGFGHLEEDEPAEGFFMLAAGANIHLEVVAFAAALRGNPLTTDLQMPGESALLGDEHLHTHIDWLIDLDHMSFDPLQTVWEAQFKLIDQGSTGYGDSEVYTLRFTNVPEPASGIVLALGFGVLGMRRRRA